MERGTPTLDEAAVVFTAILALETAFEQLRRREDEMLTQAVQALGKDVARGMATYKRTLDLLGDEDKEFWLREHAPRELMRLDEVIRCVEETDIGSEDE